MKTISLTCDYAVKVGVKRLHDEVNYEFGRAIYQDVKMRRLSGDIVVGLENPVGVIDDIAFDIKIGFRNERN